MPRSLMPTNSMASSGEWRWPCARTHARLCVRAKKNDHGQTRRAHRGTRRRLWRRRQDFRIAVSPREANWLCVCLPRCLSVPRPYPRDLARIPWSRHVDISPLASRGVRSKGARAVRDSQDTRAAHAPAPWSGALVRRRPWHLVCCLLSPPGVTSSLI